MGKCIFCAREGAEWELRSEHRSGPVHHGCGNTLVKAAHKRGSKAEVVPSRALREKWAADAFWAKMEKAQKDGRKSVKLGEVQK